jgi:hypothetical protein
MAEPLTDPDPDYILAQAWTSGAPQRDQSLPFPRGFWPDVARAAVYLALGRQPADFRQTQCTHGSLPEPTRNTTRSSSGKISAAAKAANTAALIAALQAGAD